METESAEPKEVEAAEANSAPAEAVETDKADEKSAEESAQSQFFLLPFLLRLFSNIVLTEVTLPTYFITIIYSDDEMITKNAQLFEMFVGKNQDLNFKLAQSFYSTDDIVQLIRSPTKLCSQNSIEARL